MNLNELTIADFENISNEIVKALGISSPECEVTANYNLSNPTKVEIKVPYNYGIRKNRLFTLIGILLSHLFVNVSYSTINMKIPHTKQPSPFDQQKAWNNVKQLLGNKLKEEINFKITSDKLLNYDYLSSASRPNSYTVTIEYLWS